MDLNTEKGRGVGLSLMAQRALVGATEEEGTQALQGSKALVSPHPTSTGNVGCQYKPA